MPGSVKELIQRCANVELPCVEVGIVITENPLRVTLENDAKINISVASLIIPSRKMPLERGERIYLLSLNRGKIYYVLDRV